MGTVIDKHIAVMACVALAFCTNAYTTFFWRGPADNPIWDTATANWSVSDSGSASTTFHNNNSDCLNYPAQIDLSKMTLQVNDLSKLNKAQKYTIATLAGGLKDGALFKSTNLPSDWTVRYYASTHELKIVPQRGLALRIN